MVLTDYKVYPSANAVNGEGSINTEENLSILSKKYSSKNYVIPRLDGYDMALTYFNGNYILEKGSCSIDGRVVVISHNITLEGFSSGDNVYIEITKDSNGFLSGVNIVDHYSSPSSDYLKLGTLGDGSATPDPNRLKFLKPDYIENFSPSEYIKNASGASGAFAQQIGTSLNIQQDLTVAGDLTGTGNGKVISGFSKVYNAVWNDYAEWYKKEDESATIEPGTVIAKVRGKDAYSLSDPEAPQLVVGVCSDTYGHIVGGENLENMEDNHKKYIPVALCGRVKVKIAKGIKVYEGQLLVPSSQYAGLAEPSRDFLQDIGTVIGKALESSDGSKSEIMMQVVLR